MAQFLRHSLDYLNSAEALRSMELDPYWPKWNSPWWHMTLLNEMGLAKKIPELALEKMATLLNAQPIKIFPIKPGDAPPEADLSRESSCHCAVGNMYQALSNAGVDVDAEVPWMRPWFLRYQLPDGGLNCDNEAYLKDPPPSSMVGTIACLEAVLLCTKREFTPEELNFLDRGAQCLLDRELRHATQNPHNAEEKEDEEDWLKLTFPRFYFYDILRGLSFMAKWAQCRKKTLNKNSIANVVNYLETNFPDGKVKIGRRAFEGNRTLIISPIKGEKPGRGPASHFPLLDEVSRVGEISPYLSAQWAEVRKLL
jgi:hypothetical protein